MLTRGPLIAVLATLALLAGAQSATASDLSYYGGPVAHSMNVVLVSWGSGVRSIYTDPTSGDPAFFKYLASQSGSTNDLGGVLAQYLDTSDQNSANKLGYLGAVQITPSSNNTTVQDSAIQSQLRGDIDNRTLQSPAGNGLSTLYVVLFPPGDNVCQGGSCSNDPLQGFCAYHGSFPLTGTTQVLYAAMVDNGPGSPNDGACGPYQQDSTASLQIKNQTDVTSHEFAESINDPLVAEATSNGPPLAWYDNAPDQGEIADKCEASSGPALNGPWTVQEIWSNLDGVCEGNEPTYSSPSAVFTAPSGLPAGQSLTFDGSGSSDPGADQASASDLNNGQTYSINPGIASYSWNWGDGSPDGTGVTATHSYPAQGVYNVTLTVADDLGFTASVTRPVTVGSRGSERSVQRPLPGTAGVTHLGIHSATLNGIVNPDGGSRVSYRFLYGLSRKRLLHRTRQSSVRGGTAARPVHAKLTGLKAHTRYYYRLQVTFRGHTYRGSIRRFTTLARAARRGGFARRHPPRFSIAVLRGQSLAQALAHGLRMTYRCSRACVVSSDAFHALARVQDGATVPVTLARGSARSEDAGAGRLTLYFIRAARRRLSRVHAVKLLVASAASGPGEDFSAPAAVTLTLGR